MPLSLRGRLALPLEGREVELLGGPFEACPPGAFSICLETRAANAWLADVTLPIEDFGTPDPAALKHAVGAALAALREAPGRPVFVGCRAGLGRTGLFLACLARAAGVEGDPVDFVRARYHPEAAETEAQRAMARAFTWP
jgi:hypothetical protein